jgi:phosphotransferase system  glucose/maltose/N-acetylglucosamine-specific IIC component
MAGTLKEYLGVLGLIIYFLTGLLGVGLAINFVLSLLKGDWSPWWLWPVGIVSTFVLMMIARNLVRLVDKGN